MKNYFITLVLFFVAAVPYYGPPATNPHPPVTEQEKRWVGFAENLVKKLLMTPQEKSRKNYALNLLKGEERFELWQDCLTDGPCIYGKPVMLDYVQAIKAQYGVVKDFRHPHIIPWSMEKYKKNLGAGNEPTADVQDRTNIPLAGAPSSIVAPQMAPVQRADEFMFHVYVQMESGEWYHLDIYVTVDAKGLLRFQRFYLTPMNTGGGQLPDGVVC